MKTMNKTRILWLVLGLVLIMSTAASLAQDQVRALVVNEFANIRTIPALGAELVDTVRAGYVFEQVTARSPNSEWLRVDYQGGEGWVNLAPLTLLSGNVGSLPTADPRFIPYGGEATPRAGSTSASGPLSARVVYNVRLRSGPSTAYPTLANLVHNTPVSLTGRTASAGWYQVVVDGLLGWSNAIFYEITSPGDIMTLPVDGILADAAPMLGDSADDYLAALRHMRDRLELAQPSLDSIRALWTDAALTGRAACPAFPARPTPFRIAEPLLSAYFTTLNPLIIAFDETMANLSLAIELYITACEQPGSGNPVGQAALQQALALINQVDGQFAALRARISDLLPADTVVGPDECLLDYGGTAEVLPLLSQGVIYLEDFSPRQFVVGYCLDLSEGQAISLQTLPLPLSVLSLFLSISPLDNPTAFVAVAQAGAGAPLTLSPISIPAAGRYLVILADISDAQPTGRFAFLSTDVTSGTLSTLSYDAATNSVNLVTAEAAPTPDTSLLLPAADETPSQDTSAVCPSTAFTCAQLFTCAEARACLNAGNFSLDPDGNGIPCEELLCTTEEY